MSEPESPILYDRAKKVAWIRFNRPHRLNAVSQPMYEALEARLVEAENDTEVRAVVLTGEGRAFCVGADLQPLRGLRGRLQPWIRT